MVESLPTTDTGYYVFGVARNYQPTATPGIKGAALEIISEVGDISAVGCKVDLDEFGPEVVADNMNDLDWISHVAQTHYKNCEEFFRTADSFLPFRLCTVFSSPEAVRELLLSHEEEIKAEFIRLRGKAEFGLKIWGRDEWLNQRALSSSAELREMQATVKEGGGKAFFAQKKFEGELVEYKKRLALQLGRRLTLGLLSKLALPASECKSLVIPTPPPPGYAGLANLSLLLEQERVEELQALVEKLDREALEGGLIEILGPLPTYSFIKLGREII